MRFMACRHLTMEVLTIAVDIDPPASRRRSATNTLFHTYTYGLPSVQQGRSVVVQPCSPD